ncbi:MAG: exosome complex RNA-binding protein Csl4 [Candidatus Bathyarchaeota archaeon]|nr:MAG: exosome complex RNA-binding protein Csl4 [Candidatus Bathyarchaeota archaeon]
MSKKPLKDRDVFPGEKLSVIEVLQEGPGAYHLKGDVRSAELGKARFDLKKKRVEVEKKTKELILPREGLDVTAEVGSVMRRDARVDIFSIDGKMISSPYTGEIHITSVEREFSKDMTMAMRNSDIIKAKIINTKNRMTLLSVRGPEYGVIYAHCTRCGTLLELQRGRLHCPKCDRVERRKIASTYGREELV